MANCSGRGERLYGYSPIAVIVPHHSEGTQYESEPRHSARLRRS